MNATLQDRFTKIVRIEIYEYFYFNSPPEFIKLVSQKTEFYGLFIHVTSNGANIDDLMIYAGIINFSKPNEGVTYEPF